MALVNRGITFGQTGRIEEEIADYTRVIKLPGAPVEWIAMALVNRGITFGQTGRTKEAIADYTRATELPETPVKPVALALMNRGITFGQTGRIEEEIADYTRVIELPGAPVEQVARALLNRGIVFRQSGRTEQEIADYTRVIELDGAPVKEVAGALFNRGAAFGRTGRIEEAIADYTRVIELSDAPVEQIAGALVIRGLTFGQTGRTEEAIADYTRVIGLSEAPVEQVVNVRAFLAELLFDLDRWSDALEQAAPALDGREVSASFIADAMDSAMAAILRHIGARDVWRKRAGELIALYAARDSLAILGNALVRHLARLGESLLSGKGLDEWLDGWEAAGAEYSEMRLPFRLARVGIAYLKTTPRDEGVLLDLPSEERRLARQALGLPLEKEQ
jgi:tetratricopeptide (TPR) repeat protein